MLAGRFATSLGSRWSFKNAVTVGALALVAGLVVSARPAQSGKPAVEMTSILAAELTSSGGLTMTHFNLVFGPESGAKVDIFIKTPDGKKVGAFETRPEYQASKEAFSRLMVSGALWAELDEGQYLLDFMIGDELATRFPFEVIGQGDNGDPFTTSNKKQFQGPWQELAYLHYTKSRNFTTGTDFNAVNLRMWGGMGDLPTGSNGEHLIAKLTRDGELIGHSKEPTGFLSTNKPVNRVDLVIFHPHTKQEEANVPALSEADLVSGNHTYRLSVERQNDGAVIREFTFHSKDGKLVPLPRTELGHTPHHEYLVPRAAVLGSQRFEFEPVHWLARQ